MPAEEIQLDVGDESYPGRLEGPVDGGDHGVVVLPGAGHGPYGDIFDQFAEEAASNGRYVLRFQSWEDHEELGSKTLGDLHGEIDAAVEFLEDRGCTHIAIVGKSFGAGIALTHVPDPVGEVVLWAPFLMVREESNLEADQPMDLQEYTPTIDSATLGRIEAQVRILHGDEDRLPFENSEKMADALPNGELIEIEGADHSFLGPDSGVDAVTVERTMAFLTSDE